MISIVMKAAGTAWGVRLAFLLQGLALCASCTIAPEAPLPAHAIGSFKSDIPFNEIVESASIVGRTSVPSGVVVAQIGEYHGCASPPDIHLITSRVNHVLTSRNLRTAHHVRRKNSLTLITHPQFQQDLARLYFYSAVLEQCPGSMCVVSLKAHLIVAPVRGEDSVVLMSESWYLDDEVTAALIQAASGESYICMT